MQSTSLYPDFNKPFHIHNDASHYQLGAVISQEKTSNMESLAMADCYGLDSNDLPDDVFPISYMGHSAKKLGIWQFVEKFVKIVIP